MRDPFPTYDVLAKRDTPSWNEQTRRVVDRRLALEEDAGVLGPRRLLTLRAIADRVVPQPEGRPPVNTVAMVLEKVGGGEGDGYRHHRMPSLGQAWERGLDALEAEALARHGASFAALAPDDADALLRACETGDLSDPAWGDMPSKLFWGWRLIPDIVSAYYAHPSAWSTTGFGGPASPRGYVRLGENRRDPWEAKESEAVETDVA